MIPPIAVGRIYQYQPKRVDKNQPGLVSVFRKLGCMVQRIVELSADEDSQYSFLTEAA